MGREYRCTTSTLKGKANEVLQGTFPKRVEKGVEGKEEELFENPVKYNEEKEMGLSVKMFKNKNEEDYNQSVEIKTNIIKIFISYK